MSDLYEKYLDYIQSYSSSFYDLYNGDKIDNFYGIGIVFSNLLELIIKFCILNYDGYIENWTVEGFEIGKHDVIALIKDKQTEHEFLSLGITSEEYNQFVLQIEKIQSLLGTKDFSFAFRYPCDKRNNIYLADFQDIIKNEIIEQMKICIDSAMDILFEHSMAVLKNLMDYRKKALKFFKQNK
ncbi:MAG: hypothetical protein K2J16_06060 [Clostridia bacterium]|nr:hypothetical protein [Clostridia bacterium]